jgi:TolB-like protein/cytochrome c-type biogenesis protein CcmH/NrfG
MKRCPECRRDYYDATLLYCLDDGASLLEGPASSEEPATAVMPDTRPSSENATRTFDTVHRTDTQDLRSGSRSRVYIFGASAVLLIAAIAAAGYFYFGLPQQINSIAVMPFVNESGNTENEYLSDGLTETLINNLSQLPNLSVKARSSVFSFKGKNATPQQVGTELAVQAVLNGRVMQRGDNVTLSLELVDATNGNQIWGEQYAKKMSDLTTLQSEIARDVSNKLHQKLTGSAGQPAAKNYTTDSEAYQLYLKGLFHWNKRTSDDLKAAIGYFNQSKEKDPSFALAYVGLAVTYSVLPSNTVLTKQEVDDSVLKAKAAALRALELDNTLAEPHAVLASNLSGDWNFGESENEYKRAIELNPNYATAHQWYSELLARLGRFDEAIAAIKHAYQLDPFSTAVNMNIGLRYYEAERFDEAEAQFKKTIELSPEYPMAYWYLSDLYFYRGDYEESLALGEKAGVLMKSETPESSARKVSEFRAALKTGGVKGYWKRVLDYELEEYNKGLVPAFFVAGIFAELGDADASFEWLEKSFKDRENDLTYLKIDYRFRSLRADPRFQDLLRRVGLPTT